MKGFFQINIIQLQLCITQYFVSFWISITNKSIEKLSTYECGLEPMGNSRIKFDILYYVIGILYLIFDQEIIFLFPQATIIYTQKSTITLFFVISFLIILTIGFIYEWFQGALEIVQLIILSIINFSKYLYLVRDKIETK